MNIEYTDESKSEGIFIPLGEIGPGKSVQHTVLGSCISIILFSDKLKFGCISHLIGYETSISRYNTVEAVIEQYGIIEKINNIQDPAYFLIGGSDSCKIIFECSVSQLQKYKIPYVSIDTLGSWHRKITLSPEESRISIFKKRLDNHRGVR